MTEKKQKRPTYIFGNVLGNVMSKVDVRTQFEAGLMSMSFMMVGLVITIVYLALYAAFPLWYKIFLVINLLAGLVFFMSNLVTQYQQYQNYMEVVQFKKQEKSEEQKKDG